MSTNSSYPYLRLWCKQAGSYAYYVERQVKRARETNAPPDALFEIYQAASPTGSWVTLRDLDPEHSFRQTCRDAGYDA